VFSWFLLFFEVFLLAERLRLIAYLEGSSSSVNEAAIFSLVYLLLTNPFSFFRSETNFKFYFFSSYSKTISTSSAEITFLTFSSTEIYVD